jgi:mannose-6-phosphate isomerase-like protein (cupin superfamily)
MSSGYIEREFAYEWTGPASIVNALDIVNGWDKEVRKYTLIDTIYDTPDHDLEKASTGVRVRTKDGKTVMTAKRFLRRGPSGEAIFEEQHINLPGATHPANILSDSFNLNLPKMQLERQLSFSNSRVEVNFRKDGGLVRIVNEDVTYRNSHGIYREPLLEVEFEDLPDSIIEQARLEIEGAYDLKLIHEGKTDRAMRFLRPSGLHVQNINDIEPTVMSAHGGSGNIQMRFFHTPFSRFDGAGEPKVTNYQNGNWEFFAHAILPVGAEVKEHLHDRTDELYFILNGSAKFTVDGESRTVVKGDCILTRKNSRHSLTDVTEDLEFIATEIL